MKKTEQMLKYEKETGETLDMSILSGDATGSWYGFLNAIESENQKLRDNASEVLIRDIQLHGGFLSLEAESSLGRVYAEYAAHMLEEYKAQNFVTCELKSGNTEQMYYLTVGRCNGKTVQEKYLEVCNEKVALEAKAAAYDRLMSGGKKTLKELANIFQRPVAVTGIDSAFWFEKTPKLVLDGDDYFYDGKGSFGQIPFDLIDYSGDWKDSLTLPDGWEE